MIENVFRKKYAECLIARKETSDGSKGEAVGLALVSCTCFQSSYYLDICDWGVYPSPRAALHDILTTISTSSLIPPGSASQAST